MYSPSPWLVPAMLIVGGMMFLWWCRWAWRKARERYIEHLIIEGKRLQSAVRTAHSVYQADMMVAGENEYDRSKVHNQTMVIFDKLMAEFEQLEARYKATTGLELREVARE